VAHPLNLSELLPYQHPLLQQNGGSMEEQLNEMPKLSQLEPLVSKLNAEQQLQLRQALVRQTIYYVSQGLPPKESDDGHRQGCDRATEWLETPTAEVAHNAYMWAVGECWDGGMRYSDYPEYCLFPVWALKEELDAAAAYAIRVAPESDRAAAVDWQIAAVRAIVQGQEPFLESLEVHP
jgi:hypothetical protein